MKYINLFLITQFLNNNLKNNPRPLVSWLPKFYKEICLIFMLINILHWQFKMQFAKKLTNILRISVRLRAVLARFNMELPITYTPVLVIKIRRYICIERERVNERATACSTRA